MVNLAIVGQVLKWDQLFLAANEEAVLVAGYTRTSRGIGGYRGELWDRARSGRGSPGTDDFLRTEFRRQTARGGGYQQRTNQDLE